MRRRSSSTARAARFDVRTYCWCRGAPCDDCGSPGGRPGDPDRLPGRGLIRRDELLATSLAFLHTGRLPPVHHQGFEGGPGLRGHVGREMLHLMEPTPHPQRPRPHNVHRFDEACSAVGREGDWSHQAAFEEIAQPLEATLIALTMRGREAEQHFAPVETDPPDTPSPRFPPPAPQGRIHRIDAQIPNLIATPGARTKRGICVRQAVRDLTAGACGYDDLPQRFLSGVLAISLGQPARLHRHNKGRQSITRAAQSRP